MCAEFLKGEGKVFKETEDNDNKPEMLSLIVYTGEMWTWRVFWLRFQSNSFGF